MNPCVLPQPSSSGYRAHKDTGTYSILRLKENISYLGNYQVAVLVNITFSESDCAYSQISIVFQISFTLLRIRAEAQAGTSRAQVRLGQTSGP